MTCLYEFYNMMGKNTRMYRRSVILIQNYARLAVI